MEEWNIGIMERWKNGRIRQFDNLTMEEWNVEALAEIPLRRENNGILECWKTERQATGWRNIDSINRPYFVWRCSAPKYPGRLEVWN